MNSKTFALVIAAAVSAAPIPVDAAIGQYSWGYSVSDDVDIVKSDTWVPNNSGNVTTSGRQAVSGFETQTGQGPYYHLLGTNEYWNGGYHDDFFIQYTDRSGVARYNYIADAGPYRGQLINYAFERWGGNPSTNESEWTWVIRNSSGGIIFANRFQTLGFSETASWIFVNNQNTCTKQVSTNYLNWYYRKSSGQWNTNGNSPQTTYNSSTCTTYTGKTSGTVPDPVYLWIDQ